MQSRGESFFQKMFTLLTESWSDAIVEEYINFAIVLKCIGIS